MLLVAEVLDLEMSMVEVTALEPRRFRMGTPAKLSLAGDHEQEICRPLLKSYCYTPQAVEIA